ncbi:MAG TPA: sigma-70 family RNA polymerase sigma factor [Gemmataceae bacterium]|jgi:RNA polymerase sigma factor (sigma-70 family)|nr:sigma-70 family RNA polymerase sigma factor [Gemmataceae bacterium]
MATNQMSDVIQHLRKAVLLRDGAGMTDGQLLESFISRRDGAAIEALVLRHGPMVWGVCRRVLRSQHDAEDAFQTTFLVLVRKAASIVPRDMVANWLYGVAHQTALKARAMAAKRRLRERQVTEMPEAAAVGQDLWPDLQALLDQELSRLPDKYRAAIVLCDLQGKTRKEAARQLRQPEGTVASRLMRARTMLAKRLARHGLPVSGGALAVVLSHKAASACVPTSVVSSTIKAATLLAAGQAAAAALIPAKVAALTEGVLKTMLLSKLKTMLVLVGTLSIIALGLGLSAYHGFAQQSGNENKKEPIRPAAQEAVAQDADKPDKKSEPRYCRLVFGPKSRVRALVRLDGEEVSIDRNGDGKFGKGERFKPEKDCKDVVIRDPDGKTSYVITYVHVLHVVPPETFLEVRVHIRGPLRYPQVCIIQMGYKAKGAPEAHFDGPLTIAPQGWRIAYRASRLLENELVDVEFLLPQSLKQLAGKQMGSVSMLPRSLKRTGQPTDLSACIITEGENGFVAVCSPDDKDRDTSPFRKGVHPFVDVEFPAKKQGDRPVKKRYPLDQFCCDGLFRGPVRVPNEAGVGKAKVTFSFGAWKGAKVAPTTVEIPVVQPREDKKGAQN